MSAPYRITRPSASGFLTTKPGETGQEFKRYLDRLMKIIPAEIFGLYLIGSGFIPANQSLAFAIWAIVCLGGVIAIKAYGTADQAKRKPPDWTHVAISSVAFVLWVYTIGGPFAAYNIALPYIGALLMLAWTFLVPIFYRGVID